MAELQFPNIVGQFQQGQDRGRALLANNLAGQAYSATGDQQKSLLGQLAGVNPQLAVSMTGQLQSQQIQQQATQQAQDVDHTKKVQGAANFMVQALQSKDPARIQGAWQAVHPYFSDVASSQGVTLPDQWNDSMTPGLYKILGQNGGMPEEKLTVVGPGSTALGAGGNVAFSNPSAPRTAQVADIPDGKGGTVKMQFDENARQWVPLNYGGGQGQPPAQQPPQGGMQTQLSPVGSSPVDQANAFLAQGMPPEKAAALAMGAHPGVTLAVDQATGQFRDASDGSAQIPQGQGAPQGTPPQGAPQMAPQGMPQHEMGYTPPKTVTMLSPADVKGLGLPEGTVAQRGADGAIHVVNKPADNGDAGTEMLTPDGKRLMDAAIAHGYNMPMPNMGYGKQGTKAKADAINSLAQRYKDAGVNPDDAISLMIQGKTATGGLASVQRTAANISAWEASASKQADIALDMSNKVDRTGVPLFNKWILGGRQATGDVAVAQFNNTTNTLAEEYARVMGGGNAAATDSTRALAHSMLNSAQTQPQFAGVVSKMRQEMTARTDALHGAVMSQRQSATSNEGGNMGGWDGQPSAQPTQAPQQAPAQSAQPRAINPQTGHAIVWNGSAWVPE